MNIVPLRLVVRGSKQCVEGPGIHTKRDSVFPLSHECLLQTEWNPLATWLKHVKLTWPWRCSKPFSFIASDEAGTGFASLVKSLSKETLELANENALASMTHAIKAGGPLACYAAIVMTNVGTRWDIFIMCGILPRINKTIFFYFTFSMLCTMLLPWGKIFSLISFF